MHRLKLWWMEWSPDIRLLGELIITLAIIAVIIKACEGYIG